MRRADESLGPLWDWPRARERCLREAVRYTRCPVDAEDVVQEAMMRAWRTRRSLRNTAHPMPWLLQITRNEALRRVSRNGRERERAVLVEEPEAPACGHDWTERTATRLDVQTAMRQFGQGDRAMIALRYDDELTHSTIADLMNIPVGTCKVRLHRLRKRLSVLLAEEGPA